jgi:cellulose synthase/poly-beta-1,6-N-acetylglucosamine synthase-like glycosyltransferase
MAIEATLFWTAVLLLVYTYAGYPVLAWARARLRSRPPRARSIEPAVTVVLAAHNEAARIGSRIDNLLALDYPPDRLEIVLGSDGSTDGTAERARAAGRDAVSVVAFEFRRGKPAVLNDLVPRARGEIVVLGDARQQFDRDAVRALVAPFADPGVGVVSGELVLTAHDGATPVADGVGFYWRYEKFIRRHESRADSTPGATGAIYAIRRQLFEPIPADTILDDVLIPMRVARRGYRVVLEPRARAYDRVAATGNEEFTRKVRTMAGKFQLFAREPWLLSPSGNPLWLQTVSRIGLRLLAPLLLVVAFGANLVLAHDKLYATTLAAQVLFYAAAFGGRLFRNARRRAPLLIVPYVVCLMNWAIVVGLARFLTGRQRVTWDKAIAS